jgi:glycosyltransferase involved in cell wall biosynthesis
VPLFSIITICFNSEAVIRKTVRSVIEQENFTDFEYIVIDGSSTDNTKLIIEEYHEGITHFITEKDNGIYDALNKALMLASGEYILLVHSDDCLSNSDSLLELSKLLTLSGEPDVLLTAVRYQNYNILGIRKEFILDPTYFKTWMLSYGFMPPHPGMVIKNAIFQKIGFFKTSFRIAGDFDFCVRLFAEKNLKLAKSSTFFINMNGGGTSNSGASSALIATKEISAILRNSSNRIAYFGIIRIPVKAFIRLFFKKGL